MSSSDDLSIEQKTFENLARLKSKSNFAEKSWDEWFTHVFNLNSSDDNPIEQTMQKLHNQSFDDWVQNFAQNLNDIWNEPSARSLDTSTNASFTSSEYTAIVIGRGPSVKKHKHLELIANSDFKGSIICGDGSLIPTLESGITPEKFPNFYVVTIDPLERQKKLYDHHLVDKYGSKIRGIFSTVIHPLAVNRARQAGIKIHWLHSLFDYSEGKKSFNQISATMVRSRNHKDGLPAIQTGGNVGTAAWFVGWQILKCSKIALIGIDHGWNEDDSWKKIISHGRTVDPKMYGEDISIDITKNHPSFDKLFLKIFNPDFNCYSIVDPIFQFYSNALKEFISRSPDWLTTINATEGGSIFGNRIKSMQLKQFLDICEK